MFLICLGFTVSLRLEMVLTEIKEHHLMHKIIENKGYCVSFFDEDKIFIRPENIVSTNQGLFINLDGFEFHPLPLLQFSRQRHFIQGSFARGIELAATQSKGPCPECGVNTNKYGIGTALSWKIFQFKAVSFISLLFF